MVFSSKLFKEQTLKSRIQFLSISVWSSQVYFVCCAKKIFLIFERLLIRSITIAIIQKKSRSKEWVILCRRQDLMDKSPEYLNSNCKLCSNHFEDCMCYNYLRNRSKSDAKPTLFDIPNPPHKITSKRRALQRHPTSTGLSGDNSLFLFDKRKLSKIAWRVRNFYCTTVYLSID